VAAILFPWPAKLSEGDTNSNTAIQPRFIRFILLILLIVSALCLLLGQGSGMSLISNFTGSRIIKAGVS